MDNMKALMIIVNAGFAEDVVALTREAGAGGATIINARGGSMHMSFLGITVDSEKEMIICLVPVDVAHKIMEELEKSEITKEAAHRFCFTMPVEQMTKLYRPETDSEQA